MGLSQALASTSEHLRGEVAPRSWLPVLLITVPAGQSDLRVSKRRHGRVEREGAPGLAQKHCYPGQVASLPWASGFSSVRLD